MKLSDIKQLNEMGPDEVSYMRDMQAAMEPEVAPKDKTEQQMMIEFVRDHFRKGTPPQKAAEIYTNMVMQIKSQQARMQ